METLNTTQQVNEVKTLNVNFYQLDETSTVLNSQKWNLELTDNLDKNKIIGTILNELFELVNESKQIGAKLFRLNNPIMLSVEFNGILYDTIKAKKEYQQKLKLQNNAKSKRNFAKKTILIIDSITRQSGIKDINELISELEAQIIE